jgi:hypothetical protein
MEGLFYGTIHASEAQAVTAEKVTRAFERLTQNYASIIKANGGYGNQRAT